MSVKNDPQSGQTIKGNLRVPAEDGKQTHKRQKAVALKGDGTLDAVPRITAVGFGKAADQILDIAFANDVKVRQDTDLAEILAALEVESPVPIEALDAVSEILGYVYGLNRRMEGAARPHGQDTDTTDTADKNDDAESS